MVQFQPSGIGDFSMTLMLPHWDKNLHLSQKSLVENHIFQEIHIFKIAFLAKFFQISNSSEFMDNNCDFASVWLPYGAT